MKFRFVGYIFVLSNENEHRRVTWFVNVSILVSDANTAVESGRQFYTKIKIIPPK
jgi:hypothetical protein